jgi:hypothetical protein
MRNTRRSRKGTTRGERAQLVAMRYPLRLKNT